MPRITQIRRWTPDFEKAIPPTLKHFDASLCAVVKRKPNKVLAGQEYGVDAVLDPCTLNWGAKTISFELPEHFNIGITSFNDLDPRYHEAIEAAFISMMKLFAT